MLVTGPLVRFSVLFILFSLTINAQIHPVAEADSLLRIGLDFMQNAQYDSASATFNMLKEKYPDIPLGEIYLAGLPIIKLSALKKYNIPDSLMDNLEALQDNLEDSLDLHEEDPWYYYYAGLVTNFKVYLHSLNGDYISSFFDGLGAVDYFVRCTELDSTFYDARVMTGSSMIYKGLFTKNIDWLPFVDNEAPEGEKILKEVLPYNPYSYSYAINTLAWLNIKRGDYDAAIKMLKKLFVKYPGNRTYRWTLGAAYTGKEPLKAITVFKDLLKEYLRTNDLNNVITVELKHKIAQRYFDVGEIGLALKYCNDILELKLNDFEKDILDDRLNRVADLKDELLELNN